MSDHHAEPRRIAPLFSVIIPLEYHRGQWERCWQGWQSQTLDRDSFEIILVVPPDFPERDKIERACGSRTPSRILTAFARHSPKCRRRCSRTRQISVFHRVALLA